MRAATRSRKVGSPPFVISNGTDYNSRPPRAGKIMCCRNGGTVSVVGVRGVLIDKFTAGSVMNRSLTIKTGRWREAEGE